MVGSKHAPGRPGKFPTLDFMLTNFDPIENITIIIIRNNLYTALTRKASKAARLKIEKSRDYWSLVQSICLRQFYENQSSEYDELNTVRDFNETNKDETTRD